jgi:hypothetical protein
MTVRFTDFVDLLPKNFSDLTFEAQVKEVEFLHNFLAETDKKSMDV